MTTINEFTELLLQVSPQVAEAYRQRIEDDEEFLPHVFMGDVTRLLVARKLSNNENGAVLDAIKQGLVDGSDDLQELLTVSCLENIPPNDSLAMHFAAEGPMK
jgi:hypothetical protein